MSRTLRSGGLRILLALAAVGSTLSACGVKTSSTDSLVGFTSCSPNPNNTAGNLSSATWTSPCISGQFGLMVDSLTFTGTTVTETIKHYNQTDSSCTTLQGTLVVTANYTIGGAGSSSGFNQINFTVTSAKATPATSSEANSWSSTVFVNGSNSTTGYCGITSWAAGTQTDITGKTDVPSECNFPTTSSVKQMFGLGNVTSSGLGCGTPVNGAAFGYSLGNGVLPGSSTTSYPTSAWGQIFDAH